MKKNLLKLMLCIWSLNAFGQAPQIEGDVLLCPWTDGTVAITNSQTYDSYQWYFKYWFLPDEFQAISGANAASFTYDWYTYDQALFKVVVTLNGETFESNTIQVDSWAWVGLVLINEMNENVIFDPNTEAFLLCEGTTFDLSINNPPYDTNITWYKNDEPIAGANLSTYTITEPGLYYVSAAPSFCPDNSSNSLEILVAWNPDCNLSIDNPNAVTNISVYPNPVKNEFIVTSQNNLMENYTLLDVTGKVLATGTVRDHEKIDISNLSAGMYLLQLKNNNQITTHKIIKE